MDGFNMLKNRESLHLDFARNPEGIPRHSCAAIEVRSCQFSLQPWAKNAGVHQPRCWISAMPQISGDFTVWNTRRILLEDREFTNGKTWWLLSNKSCDSSNEFTEFSLQIFWHGVSSQKMISITTQQVWICPLYECKRYYYPLGIQPLLYGRYGPISSRIYRHYLSGDFPARTILVGGLNPSEKYESQLGLLFPIYGKTKNVPNHQPLLNYQRGNTFGKRVTEPNPNSPHILVLFSEFSSINFPRSSMVFPMKLAMFYLISRFIRISSDHGWFGKQPISFVG